VIINAHKLFCLRINLWAAKRDVDVSGLRFVMTGDSYLREHDDKNPISFL
jgi:hypothetical protein